MRGENTARTTRARQLRQTDNDAEGKLWSELRNRRLNGYKFVRQMPIGPYFADFACRQGNLVVEVDGSQHVETAARDAYRNETMNRNGWSVIRFWNIDVLMQRRQVCETILAALEGRLKAPVFAPDLQFFPSRETDI